MRYRRAKEKGGTYFFTVALLERNRSLLTDNADLLLSTVSAVAKRHPFNLDAFVILPEHLHMIWTLPAEDAGYSVRWALIKAGFSRRMAREEPINASRATKGERGIWQRRYWEHCIRNEDDYMRHIDYIHFNPVKHGYVSRAVDWPHSSLHRYIREGRLPRDWGCGKADGDQGDFGE